MAYALVQNKGVETTGTNPTATFSATPTTGNLLVAVLCTADGTSANVTNPAGWSQRANKFSTASPVGGVRIIERIAPASPSATVTFTDATSSLYSIELYEFSGNPPSSEFDTVAAGAVNAGTTSLQPANITPTTAADLFVVGCYQAGTNGGSEAIDSSFTMIDSGVFASAVMGYKIKTDGAAENPTSSWATSRGAIATQVAFLPAPIVTNENLAGSTTPAGVLTLSTTTVLSGSTTPAGTATVGFLFQIVVGGTITPVGVLVSAVNRWLAVSGTLALSALTQAGKLLARRTRRRRGPASSSTERGPTQTDVRRGPTNTAGRASISDTDSEP